MNEINNSMVQYETIGERKNIDEIVYEYDNYGRLVHEKTEKCCTPCRIYDRTYIYDFKGLLVCEITKTVNTTTIKSFMYNDVHLLSMMITQDAGIKDGSSENYGQYANITKYKYDSDNNLIKKTNKCIYNIKNNTFYKKHRFGYAYNNLKCYEVIETKDSSNCINIFYEYDSNGLLIKEIQKGMKHCSIITYSYDTMKLVHKHEEYQGYGCNSKNIIDTKYVYNNENLLIKSVENDLYDKDERITEEFYEYDNNKHLIRKSTYFQKNKLI